MHTYHPLPESQMSRSRRQGITRRLASWEASPLLPRLPQTLEV